MYMLLSAEALQKTYWGSYSTAAHRLLSPSRIYKQIYAPIETKTELAAACQALLAKEPQLSYPAAVHQLAQGVAVTHQPNEQNVDYGLGGQDQELHQFHEHDLLDHAAFVVQQLGPMFGRHSYKVGEWCLL